VLNWGKANNVRFGLGGAVTAMILASRPDDEIMAAIQDKFGPDEMERLAR
jgi:phosphotransferase system  glucose/maltose/N-acetylglucosamine-specific IIC component